MHPAAAHHDDPAGLALAAAPADIGVDAAGSATGWRIWAAARKPAIVALARKLLVALWKYVTTGVVIEGAAMKPA